MPLSIRPVFAASLCGLALIPPVLFAVHSASPDAAVRLVQTGGVVVRYAAMVSAAMVALGMLLYPPFLPSLRLAVARAKSRLGTDQTPLREAKARLQHLETAADLLVAGRASLALGKVDDSIGHLSRAVELDPTHAASRYQLGLALAHAGQLQASAEQFSRVIEQDPAHAFGAAMLELGVVLERLADDERAVAMLERHDKEFGANRRNLFHRARALSRLGRRDDAIEILRQAAKPPEANIKLPVEEELVRARARVALLRGGKL